MRKQTELPTIESNHIQEITDAAEAFEEKRDKWIKLKQPMIDAKDELQALMLKHGLETYRDDDLTVTRTSKANVKVKRTSQDEEE